MFESFESINAEWIREFLAPVAWDNKFMTHFRKYWKMHIIEIEFEDKTKFKKYHIFKTNIQK